MTNTTFMVAFSALALAVGATDKEVEQMWEHMKHREPIPETRAETIAAFNAALWHVRGVEPCGFQGGHA